MEYDEFRDRRRGCNGIQSIGIFFLVAGIGAVCIPMFATSGSVSMNTVYALLVAGLALVGVGGLVMWRGRVARDELQWDVEQGQRVYSYGGEPRFKRYGSHRPHKHELEDDSEQEESLAKAYNRQREELQGAFGFSRPNLHM